MRAVILSLIALMTIVSAPAQAGLYGQDFGLKVSYGTFNPPFATGTLLVENVTAGVGVEVDNLAITYSYIVEGFEQKMNGQLDVDLLDDGLLLSFSGFSVPSSLSIELTAPAGGSFTSATRTSSTGFTPGSNQPGNLTRTEVSIRTGFFFLGTDNGTQAQQVAIGFTPPAPAPVSEPGIMALLGLGLLGVAASRRRA